MLARLPLLTAALVATLTGGGAACEECKSLLDCPLGQICTVDGACVDECPPGDYSIEIVVTAPDQITAVAGEVDVDGGGFAATGASATITATVSSGKHVFSARRGDFTGETSVEVCGDGQRVAVPVRPPPGSVGVVQGVFDNIDDVLAGMGFVRGVDFVVIGAAEISTPGGLDALRYIFINCGHDLPLLDAALGANLFAWVEGGGALYTSDLAFDVVETVFPGHATGGGGGNPGLFQAQVLDAALAEHLGKTDVELDYNLGAWRHIDGVAPGTVELVRGSEGEVRGMPLLLQFQEGEGRVTYTTFHNEAQTTADMDRILSYLVFSL